MHLLPLRTFHWLSFNVTIQLWLFWHHNSCSLCNRLMVSINLMPVRVLVRLFGQGHSAESDRPKTRLDTPHLTFRVFFNAEFWRSEAPGYSYTFGRLLLASGMHRVLKMLINEDERERWRYRVGRKYVPCELSPLKREFYLRKSLLLINSFVCQ